MNQQNPIASLIFSYMSNARFCSLFFIFICYSNRYNNFKNQDWIFIANRIRRLQLIMLILFLLKKYGSY